MSNKIIVLCNTFAIESLDHSNSMDQHFYLRDIYQLTGVCLRVCLFLCWC